MSRPLKITEALIEEFCSRLRFSGSIETAIMVTGIGRESYYGLARRVGEGKGTKLEKRLISAVSKAEGEVKMDRECRLTKHFDKHPEARKWWLERKYSNEYRPRRPKPVRDPDEFAEQPIERIVWAEAPRTAPIKTEQGTATAKPTETPEAEAPDNVEGTSAQWVAGSYYETRGLAPISGRLLTPDDDGLDAPLVAVITDSYWASRFERDPKVIGQSVEIESVAVTIVGVSPLEITSTAERPMPDFTMATGVKPRIPLGARAWLLRPNCWILGVILPTCLFLYQRQWKDALR